MNHPAPLHVERRSLDFASTRAQAPLPGPEPVPQMPPLPPEEVPPPLDVPPQIPPEIREPEQPGEHAPIGDPRPPTPTRH